MQAGTGERVAMTSRNGKKLCFVVGPIGDDNSEDRVHADWLLEEIITPVFHESFSEFDLHRADKISEPGRIDAQVISALLDAELVIADLSTLNPNAFYEIGIRHMAQKPIVHMHLEGQRIPFDVGMFRSIKFSRRTPTDLRKARAALKDAVAAAIADGHKVDNPVTVARGRVQLQESASSAEKVLWSEIQAIKNRFSNLERDALVLPRARARSHQFRIDIAPGSVQATQGFQEYAYRMLDTLYPSYKAEPNGDMVVTVYVQDTSDNRKALELLKKEASAAELQVSVS